MMMRRWLINAMVVASSLALLACGESAQEDSSPVNEERPGEGDDPNNEDNEDEGPEGIAALGGGQDSLDAVELTTVADEEDGLNGPRDLEINPHAPTEMWIVNRTDHSATILFDFGTADQTSQKYQGFGNRHFTAKPAALAFGAPGYMTTAQQEDEITQSTTPADFMGPTLWTSDSSAFDAGHASHLDMLHNSPLSSGAAWDEGNAYWIMDGYHGAIAHYDFNEDHGPGGSDHRDGVVRRYANEQLSVVNEIVAHIAFDRDAQLLYIADTGNNRIAVLETDTGELGDRITPNYDGSDQRMIDDAVLRTFIDGEDAGFAQPAGLELVDGVLYIGDNGSSTIYAYDTDGELLDSLNLSQAIPAGAMMGMAIDDDGRIYVANAEDNTIVRIAPKGE